MPIRAELRHFYRGPAWRATRAAVLDRARNRCEWCRKPNHTFVFAYNGQRDINGRPVQYWLPIHGRVWRQASGHAPHRGRRMPRRGRRGKPRLNGLPAKVYVVLTVAHLNHLPGDDRLDNLAALCQWCHLAHDRPQHQQTRATRKDAARPLLQEAS